jgi:curved DNA-binding protein CbpA
MPSPEAFAIFLRSLDKKSYYNILRIPENADKSTIKHAFYDFANLYHPDRYVDEPASASIAAEVFKRGVEAYRCLSRKPLRDRYDRGLARGRLRLDATRASTLPPPPLVRTLETIARTQRAKAFATKADRFLSIGMLEEARVELASACQQEPDNAELQDRLQILYEALALEPP